MRIDRYSDFISVEEQLELIRYFEDSSNDPKVFNKGLQSGVWGYDLRYTTRNTHDITYPSIISTIYNRILDSFNFTSDCHKEQLANGTNIICVNTSIGGDTYYHVDPANCNLGSSVIRFNVLVQRADTGGILRVTNEHGQDIYLDIEERELYCCNLSDYWHSVSTVEGNKPRYIVLFSICCPRGDWENNIINRK